MNSESKKEFVSLLTKLLSLHPDNLSNEIQRLQPLREEYEKEKKNALIHYENACRSLSDLESRLSTLYAYERFLNDTGLKGKPKCQYCDKEGVGFPIEYVDYSPGKPWCCKEHRNQITRASKRRELVYKYLDRGIDKANELANTEISDDWVPEGWEK